MLPKLARCTVLRSDCMTSPGAGFFDPKSNERRARPPDVQAGEGDRVGVSLVRSAWARFVVSLMIRNPEYVGRRR
jgi:hypothetical protein